MRGPKADDSWGKHRNNDAWNKYNSSTSVEHWRVFSVRLCNQILNCDCNRGSTIGLEDQIHRGVCSWSTLPYGLVLITQVSSVTAARMFPGCWHSCHLVLQIPHETARHTGNMRMKELLLGTLLILQMVSFIEIICVNVSVSFNMSMFLHDEESA